MKKFLLAISKIEHYVVLRWPIVWETRAHVAIPTALILHILVIVWGSLFYPVTKFYIFPVDTTVAITTAVASISTLIWMILIIMRVGRPSVEFLRPQLKRWILIMTICFVHSTLPISLCYSSRARVERVIAQSGYTKALVISKYLYDAWLERHQGTFTGRVDGDYFLDGVLIVPINLVRTGDKELLRRLAGLDEKILIWPSVSINSGITRWHDIDLSLDSSMYRDNMRKSGFDCLQGYLSNEVIVELKLGDEKAYSNALLYVKNAYWGNDRLEGRRYISIYEYREVYHNILYVSDFTYHFDLFEYFWAIVLIVAIAVFFLGQVKWWGYGQLLILVSVWFSGFALVGTFVQYHSAGIACLSICIIILIAWVVAIRAALTKRRLKFIALCTTICPFSLIAAKSLINVIYENFFGDDSNYITNRFASDLLFGVVVAIIVIPFLRAFFSRVYSLPE